ncbi:CpaF family protein, partial [Litorivivens sp.]
ITIEETAELKLDHPHVIPLEARQSNMEGLGKIELRDLVKTSLRMRADRIVVGEVRGGEVMDMLQAMNVGHSGSMTTVHANNSHDVLRRLEALALMSDAGVPRESIREMIASAVQLIVHINRFRDGKRRVCSISQVIAEGDELRVEDIYRFDVSETTPNGEIRGQHHYNGIQPRFLEQVKTKGFDAGAHGLGALGSGEVEA